MSSRYSRIRPDPISYCFPKELSLWSVVVKYFQISFIDKKFPLLFWEKTWLKPKGCFPSMEKIGYLKYEFKMVRHLGSTVNLYCITNQIWWFFMYSTFEPCIKTQIFGWILWMSQVLSTYFIFASCHIAFQWLRKQSLNQSQSSLFSKFENGSYKSFSLPWKVSKI